MKIPNGTQRILSYSPDFRLLDIFLRTDGSKFEKVYINFWRQVEYHDGRWLCMLRDIKENPNYTPVFMTNRKP